jgi:hypothetical protein
VQTNHLAVNHNTENKSFEVQVESYLAELNYYINEDTIIFTHTGVPAALEGRGIGSLLVSSGLKYAKEMKLKVESRCWFVDKYMQRHPNE